MGEKEIYRSEDFTLELASGCIREMPPIIAQISPNSYFNLLLLQENTNKNAGLGANHPAIRGLAGAKTRQGPLNSLKGYIFS